MARLFNICSRESYTDRDGNEKTSWPKVGKLVVTEYDGRKSMFITLNFLPGIKFSVFPIEPRQDQEQAHSSRTTGPSTPSQTGKMCRSDALVTS